MDDATFEVMEKKFTDDPSTVQYWVSYSPEELKTAKPGETGHWIKDRPNEMQRRVPGMVHESSVTPMGEKPDGKNVVGLDFRPFGINNVYVTGSGLWSSASSWNPTLTMCALAQRLAENLSKHETSNEPKAYTGETKTKIHVK